MVPLLRESEIQGIRIQKRGEKRRHSLEKHVAFAVVVVRRPPCTLTAMQGGEKETFLPPKGFLDFCTPPLWERGG